MLIAQQNAGWQITEFQLDLIWSNVYRRIVALAWQSVIYYSLFESSHRFRRHEFNRILGILHSDSDEPPQLQDNMGIFLQAEERRTDLILTPAGLFLPWPEMNTSVAKPEHRPFKDKLFEAYHLNGGVLPRRERNLGEEGKLDEYEALQKWYIHLLDGDPVEDTEIQGRQAIDLVARVLFQPTKALAERIVRGAGLSGGNDGDEAKFMTLIVGLYGIEGDDESNGLLLDPEEFKNVNLDDLDAEYEAIVRFSIDGEDVTNGDLVNSDLLLNEARDDFFLSDAYFFGEQFGMLVEQVPKIIARGWDDAAYRKEWRGVAEDDDGNLLGRQIRARLQRDKLTDISIPSNIRIFVGADVEEITVVVANSGLVGGAIDWTLRLPDLPEPQRPHMFREMITGYATNPLYSNTY